MNSVIFIIYGEQSYNPTSVTTITVLPVRSPPLCEEVLPVEEKATSPSRIAALKEEGAKVSQWAKGI